jgi:DNA polymerase
MPKVSVDIETLSEADLKRVGSHVYMQHPSTRLLCLAYAIDDGPVKVWRAAVDPDFPNDLYAAMADDSYEFHAWNAGGFEMLSPILKGVPAERWRCTMIRAMYWGLPGKLEQAAEALRTGWQKDMAGHRLMLQMSRPRKDGTFWHDVDPDKYDRLCAYCAQDVETERDIANQLPDLPASELELWRIDHDMMCAGMPVDTVAIDAMRGIADLSVARLDEQMRKASLGNVRTVNSVGALLKYCHDRMAGMALPQHIREKMLPSTSKEDIDAFLSQLENDGSDVKHKAANLYVPKDVPIMLRIRKEAAKSSVAKLQAMANCTMPDATIRGLTQFYGASRTGRWAGRLVQVQNLPRGIKGVDPKVEIESIIQQGNFYAPPTGTTTMEVLSSCLRGCFKPKSGKFYVGDFSQIEARVVAWLAGQQDILDVFASGQDVYTYTANKLGSKDRQFGKVLVLACGFGMGWSKFKDTAATYGLTLTDDEAQTAVKAWRDASPHIVNFWRCMEKMARSVIEGKPGAIARWGNIKMAMGSRKLAGCLLIGLPSGRHLVYRNVRLVDGDDGFAPRIVYDGVNQTTRRWEAVTTYGGKLCENIVQAVASDLLRDTLRELKGIRSLVPLVTIHDEVVCIEGPSNLTERQRLSLLSAAMSTPPAWAGGLPTGADVKTMERYGK